MEGKPQKWEGLVSTKLPSIEPDQAWSLVRDFFNLHKLLASLTTCRHDNHHSDDVDAIQPGCVRYCEGEPDRTGSVYWVKERLVKIDSTKRTYSYVITENNMGFREYLASLSVVEDEVGSRIEWRFEAEPVPGWTRDGFFEYMDGGVKTMGERVVALCSSASKGDAE